MAVFIFGASPKISPSGEFDVSWFPRPLQQIRQYLAQVTIDLTFALQPVLLFPLLGMFSFLLVPLFLNHPLSRGTADDDHLIKHSPAAPKSLLKLRAVRGFAFLDSPRARVPILDQRPLLRLWRHPAFFPGLASGLDNLLNSTLDHSFHNWLRAAWAQSLKRCLNRQLDLRLAAALLT